MPTATTTAKSRATMNQAARFAVCGEGWVIPMVLMKAFEMSRRRFMFESAGGSIITGSCGLESVSEGESEATSEHLL
jgi:hypothetical protein